MKKLFLSLALMASMLFTACQKEEMNPNAQGASQVTFSVEIPDIAQTRANGNEPTIQDIENGAHINDLVYAVYRIDPQVTDEDDAIASIANATPMYKINPDAHAFDGGKTNVTIELMNDQNYVILFWAQFNDKWTGDGLDFDLTNMTYPDNLKANDTDLAAFSGVSFIQSVDGARNETVTLTRPFAQINVGTTLLDPNKFNNFSISTSNFSVSGAGNGFNVATQNVTSTTTAEFDYAELKQLKTLTVNKKDYVYVAMNYIFAPENGVDVDFIIKTSHGDVSTSIPNVPVAKNYKTNIVGNLLTSNVSYEVTLEKEWDILENIYVWNGTEINQPKQSSTDANIYIIENPSELAWLAAAVNGTLPDDTKATPAPQDFAGKTFKLNKDIDLCNYEWTPIGTDGKPFKGTFDGQSHTVKNLKITGNNSNAGLFGYTTDGEIKNLTVENAKVSGRLNVGVVAGQPYTSKYTNITVEGHVVVNGMAYVGGVGGKNAYANWTNITVDVDENSYVNANSVENGTAYRTYVGGVVGFNGEGGHSFKNITSNINVQGSTCDVGGLFGIAHYGNNFENCSCSGNVEIYAAEEAEEAEEIGGIAGVWHNGGENVIFTNCEFNGTLSTNIPESVDLKDNTLTGKAYSTTGTGKLIVNGYIYVTTASQLQTAVNDATGDVTIKLGANINGDITVIQKAGVKITIDGCNIVDNAKQKYNGIIKVHSNSNHYSDAALTIMNVNFETNAVRLNSENEESFNFIEALENGSERYSTNITVEACTFTATGDAKDKAVGLQIKSSKNAKVLNCTATGMHSLIQAQSCDESVVVNSCTINGKNGVAFKQVKAAIVEGTAITATGYGIRFDGNTDNYGITVRDNNITAVQPFIVRKMTGKNNTIALEGTNTLSTEAEYQIVITNGSDDQEYVKPTGSYTLTGADDYTIFPAPFPVSSWNEFTAALAAGETKIKLTADITYDANYQLQKSVVIDLNKKSMTLPMINIHTASTIKNGTINGKVYARKNSDIVFDNVKFSGAVGDNLSTEGHLAIQGGCKKLYVKDCEFSPTSVFGSQTKPVSFEGGSTIIKFENCEFKSSPYKKQVYLNSLSATGTLDFTNCNFNNKTPNIMFAAACPLTNFTMSGTTKLGSVTLEINRAKEAVTADDLEYLRTLIANNSISSVRLFYAGGSSEYIR